ncbi:MAG: 2-hydroxymuconate tautomerase family protein [Nitrososphaerales archaeon]
MPLVIIEILEGRTTEQKEKLIRGVTKVFEQIGTNPQSVQVVIHESPKVNWGLAGVQLSKK